MKVYIDTAVKGCNVALFDSDAILAMHHEPIERGHAEAILPIFEKMMAEVGKTPQDIDEIYVTVGPGSFTGLRVGLTTAQFMGFSLGKPVHGISTFQAFSCAIEKQVNRLVLVETKRADFYYHWMDEAHKPIGQAGCLLASDIQMMNGDFVLTGDAVDRFVEETGFDGEVVAQDVISMENVIAAIQSDQIDLLPADAFYIRDADVSQPKATTR